MLDAASADVGPRAGREAAPGFKTIDIRPSLCDLAWAKGSVPTPQGDVKVSWALRTDKLTLKITVPAGSDANVITPTSRFEQPTVTMNGRTSEPVVRVPSRTVPTSRSPGNSSRLQVSPLTKMKSWNRH